MDSFWHPHNQNYEIFCAWSGIRRETAEHRAGHPIPSIAEDRGLPTDSEIEADEDGYIHQFGYSRDYDITWMTIAEIVAYDWSVLSRENLDMAAEALRVWPDRSQHDKIRLIMGFA